MALCVAFLGIIWELIARTRVRHTTPSLHWLNEIFCVILDGRHGALCVGLLLDGCNRHLTELGFWSPGAHGGSGNHTVRIWTTGDDLSQRAAKHWTWTQLWLSGRIGSIQYLLTQKQRPDGDDGFSIHAGRIHYTKRVDCFSL